MFGGALMKKVLIIEDDKNINEMLQELLSNNGYNVSSAYSGTEALLIHNKQIDLIVLDLMLPGKNGEEIIKKLKTINDVPIIITTAINDIDKKLDLFELGADDYVIKPFSPKELEARVKAVLRRTNNREMVTPSGKVTKNVITTGNIKIDTARRQVYRKNERIRLTGMEFSLLELLVNNSGQAFSRNEILQHVWAYPPDHRIDTRVVDVHISRLRSKLETDPANPELILTARGIGYMFQRIN